MKIGAVIIAAGRNDEFEPLQTLGSITLAERNIVTLRHAGVFDILVVTGYKADDLEHHLAKYDVMFFRNPNYERSEMIDSYRIGIGYLRDKCERILLMPSDIPFFTTETIRSLTDTEGDFVQPVYNGRSGHPIILSSRIASRLDEYRGNGGLAGALAEFGIDPVQVEVDDPGILLEYEDAHGNEDLLSEHSRSLIRPMLNISFAREKIFFDSRIALLLSLVGDLGSVSKACRTMQISYTKGWNMIRSIELETGCELIKRSVGGLSGSSSELTGRGRELLEAYRRFVEIMYEHADEEFCRIIPEWIRSDKQ